MLSVQCDGWLARICGLFAGTVALRVALITMFDLHTNSGSPTVWTVGALCRAVADTLEARFNPVHVRGEITGFSRAASGHCYFSIKDTAGQIRCAMFRRAAMHLGFTPRDGELVELSGRIGVYEQRGDLQLIVESLQRAGQGALFEQFMRLKAQLEAQGLFDAARKRPLPVMPRGIGLVTSPGAAALHDVATALARRVPHIPVVLAPALVQGAAAPSSIVQALQQLYVRAQQSAVPPIDVILLVRGGGSMEDLWAFNDEQLAHTIVQSPVPLISGVGHETDFTIADFCADVRAPTPTAAAELVAQPRDAWLAGLEQLEVRVQAAAERWVDRQGQRLDAASQRLGRPSGQLAQQRLRCERLAQQLQHGMRMQLQRARQSQQMFQNGLMPAVQRSLQSQRQLLAHLQQRLDLLNPERVLQRGYSLLTDHQGRAVTQVRDAPVGAALTAHLSDGKVDVTVTQPKLL